ncbi:MAG: TIGR02444 family protein [Rhodospirillaceae bacterium]|nr:TIGR02444 family protein [Rhodospirillaceae bacterium]HAA92641.1 TIGR02444 family protein [Rhodospirillaceae bacterium]|tara:strand:+ start:522 stop:1079 length:558 start_codon:yes stop_codon:yes gene_type:complete
MSDDSHPFWQFSIDVYGQDGVPEACIALQETCGIDVNILLFCCWAGSAGHPSLTAAEITTANDAVSSWNKEMVQGLRAVRNRLKEGFDGFDAEGAEALRQRVLGVEINAEHKEQLRLAEVVEITENPDLTLDERLENCVSNLAKYFADAAEGEPALHAEMAAILGNVFPDSSKAEIEAAITKAFA